MKEYIDENGNKRFVSEPEGNDWLDEAYRSAEKEIDEEVKETIVNIAVSYLEKDTFVKMKNMSLPPPPPEDVGMWHRHMLKRMAIDAGKTEEEMIQYLNELPSFSNFPPADSLPWHLKNLKKDE